LVATSKRFALTGLVGSGDGIGFFGNRTAGLALLVSIGSIFGVGLKAKRLAAAGRVCAGRGD
jgi:hypothetical protein